MESASSGLAPDLSQVLVRRVQLHALVAPPVHVGDDDSRRAAQACCAVHVHTLATLQCLRQRLHCLGQHAAQAVWIKVARLQSRQWTSSVCDRHSGEGHIGALVCCVYSDWTAHRKGADTAAIRGGRTGKMARVGSGGRLPAPRGDGCGSARMQRAPCSIAHNWLAPHCGFTDSPAPCPALRLAHHKPRRSRGCSHSSSPCPYPVAAAFQGGQV